MAAWVAREIMPGEARVRAWLARSRQAPEDIDEVIQEAYCRLAMLESVDHIGCPSAYFHSVVRNLLVRRLRRNRVVSIEAMAEIEAYRDDRPSPEQEAAGKSDYARMLVILGTLPERCRRVVELRKIEGWSQKQIGEHLGITEKAVEKQVWLGIKLLRAAWGAETSDDPGATRPRFRNGRGK
jgi:RNA polymerase sigma-70 factor (ECF subfamily)